MSAAPTTLVLIDGHALAFRSLFALRRGEPHVPRLSNSAGEATDAIQGFLSMTLRLAKQRSNQVIVVFDPPVKTFRHEQFDGYKAGRADAPTDLHGQIDRIREIVDALGLKRPIYLPTSAYGHFGRTTASGVARAFPWERTDLVDDLKAALA